MSSPKDTKRTDDKFMRKGITALIVGLALAAITAAVGWNRTLTVTETKLEALTEKVQNNLDMITRFDGYFQDINQIKIMVAGILENGKQQNQLIKQSNNRQRSMYGEQQRRGPILKDAYEHTKDKDAHRK